MKTGVRPSHTTETHATPPEARREGRTRLGELCASLADEPAGTFEAWARTTAGAVALLVALQMATGVLLVFYYVPSTESAHATVAFVEKVVPSGSWVRALHAHGSRWLVVALVAHLARMLLVREGWRRRPVGWAAAVALLALALAEGATGYSLPWDARAYFSTRVAASVAGGLPLVGDAARAWLLGGGNISTLTLSRFFALHALVLPALVLSTLLLRFFILREPAASDETTAGDGGTGDETAGAPAATGRRSWRRAQLARQSIVAGLVFAALALYAWKFPAPLGPAPEAAAPGYLPRPGAQFLWLFQLLKYLPPRAASLVALALPSLLLGGLALLPFLRAPQRPRLNPGVALFALGLALVVTLTALAYVEDARDPRVREQLARQARDEEEFRRAPFEPRRARADAPSGVEGANASDGGDAPDPAAPSGDPPAAYTKHCARCHGARGEGRFVNPPLVGVSARPQRTVEDLVRIMNDPSAYGLESRMPSFARKLTEEEKRAVAEWVASLTP